jgi:hypothetical protein
MSPDTIKFIITAVLFLHGVAHGWAFFQLLPQATNPNAKPAIPVRSWLFPKLSPRPAAIAAGVYWLLSGIGFIGAALSLWNAPATGLWRQLAVGSALISTIGIVLFSGIWPGAPNRKLSNLDTIIALVVNIAVFLLVLVLNWPPYEMFGG